MRRRDRTAAAGHMQEEFEAYLKCSRLGEGSPARALQAPRREACRVQLQEARVLPVLRKYWIRDELTSWLDRRQAVA